MWTSLLFWCMDWIPHQPQQAATCDIKPVILTGSLSRELDGARFCLGGTSQRTGTSALTGFNTLQVLQRSRSLCSWSGSSAIKAVLLQYMMSGAVPRAARTLPSQGQGHAQTEEWLFLTWSGNMLVQSNTTHKEPFAGHMYSTPRQ